MNNTIPDYAVKGNFYLSKWFLDFVGESGEVMIFYSAKLIWRGLPVSYTSWLNYYPTIGVNTKSRFHGVQKPQISGEVITWNDIKFGVGGRWKSLAPMIQTKLVDTDEGFLYWKCFQPASGVSLRIGDRILEGRGYAELLILTIPPWKITMDELRWGRFDSAEYNMVWIELRSKVKKQWLWLNGEKIDNCQIEDDYILMPDKELVLNLDRRVVLESEKKISSVVEILIRYLPGFNKIIPPNFVMADEFKWFSHGRLHNKNRTITEGNAIHELVNFKAT